MKQTNVAYFEESCRKVKAIHLWRISWKVILVCLLPPGKDYVKPSRLLTYFLSHVSPEPLRPVVIDPTHLLGTTVQSESELWLPGLI
jgi:hypothetical protein